MSKNSTRVLAGLIKLSGSEQEEVLRQFDRYRRKDQLSQRLEEMELAKSVRIDAGPLKETCVCCGR